MHTSFSTFLLLLVITFIGCNAATTPTAKPTIASFVATPPSLPAGGGSVTLSWYVKNANSLSIDNDVGVVSGTNTIVSMTSSKTFILTASNDAGSVTQSTSVSVGAGEDTTPPAVVSVDPPDGATGVKDDASIVIAFSEKMNQAATEDAFQRSINFPDASVTYNWNAEGTILTIQPNDFLDYAAGDDPSIPAITYSFGFVDTAKDLAGNSLEPFSSSFSTLKVIVTSIYATASLDGDILGIAPAFVYPDSAVIRVGETGDSVARGYFSFDLTGIPAGVVTDEVRLIINKEGVEGNPYEFSSMSLDHVIYGSSLSEDDYDTPILADLGIFDSSSDPVGYLSSDVTLAINNDLANREIRGNRSQYRLSFRDYNMEKGPANLVTFTSSEGPEGQRPFLNIVYYLP
ncbi:MAG: Ig-like domain-containing protein [Trueperaceae bacterium]|nr:Ig-like domain-containing protein [Trueperaceae bacterium]